MIPVNEMTIYLSERLKHRCLSELMEDKEFSMLSEEAIKEKIQRRLDKYDALFRGLPNMNKQTCAARAWSDRRGHQCSKQKREGDYCTQHAKEIRDRGYLQFKRYDEERPIINEHGDMIPWCDGHATLDILFRYQRMNLHKLLKQRKITP